MTANGAELKPLSARSVVLSLLLGHASHRMAPADVTRAGEYFGIPAATMRVALTRAAAVGDLVRDDGDYVLSPRFAARQRRQDEGVAEIATAWDGRWEMAVVVVAGRTGADRAALRQTLLAARLAELREGVWTRPANLSREASYTVDPVLLCFTASDVSREVAGSLWDLEGWARTGHDLLRALAGETEPMRRLSIAAHIVRHLAVDPILPRELLPPGWPGEELRHAYRGYQRELRTASIAGADAGR